jgi:hypothetical protein
MDRHAALELEKKDAGAGPRLTDAGIRNVQEVTNQRAARPIRKMVNLPGIEPPPLNASGSPGFAVQNNSIHSS